MDNVVIHLRLDHVRGQKNLVWESLLDIKSHFTSLYSPDYFESCKI